MASKVQELETENKQLREKGILGQLNALGDTLHLELKSIRTEQELKHRESQLVLSQILEQAKKTNGRVSRTEEEIELLKLKYQELLASTININTLLEKHALDEEESQKDLKFFRFIGQFPKAVWIILVILFMLLNSPLADKIVKILSSL